MVSGRGEHGISATRRGPTSMKLTAYEKERKPHLLRSNIDTRSVRIEWIANELACGVCRKTIQNTMVIRNCMHRFCADCILSKIHTGAKKCPLCKKVLPKKTPLKSDANFDAVISKFAMTPERRCLKRPTSDSSNLCFSKKRLLTFDKKAPVKRVGQPETKSLQNSPDRQSSLKNKANSLSKLDSIAESSAFCSDVKPALLTDSRSEALESSVSTDKNSADGAAGLSQPTTSGASVEGQSPLSRPQQPNYLKATKDSGKGNAVILKRGPIMNFSPQSAVVVLECISAASSDSQKAAQNHVTASNRNSATSEAISKFIPIQPHPSPSSAHVSSTGQQRNSMISSGSLPQTPGTGTTSQQQASSSVTSTNAPPVNGIVRQVGDEKETEQSCSAVAAVNDAIAPPPEYLFLPQRQRLCTGFDAELILFPDASVILDKRLPDVAKRPRFVATYPRATIGHLCEYVTQRVSIESGMAKLKKKRAVLCAVKADLRMDDVLVVSETGEGQFATVNARAGPGDPRSSCVFTIASPFAALDDNITVEKLKNEYWSNKKRPLKLIFKFITVPQGK